mmetsp:Transcript_32306/g.66012  ORF Transcript_32306/g.66012 Transcript_32306/m.66012 type:complete len:103 (-) Transcript_32306:305-613(-)
MGEFGMTWGVRYGRGLRGLAIDVWAIRDMDGESKWFSGSGAVGKRGDAGGMLFVVPPPLLALDGAGESGGGGMPELYCLPNGLAETAACCWAIAACCCRSMC